MFKLSNLLPTLRRNAAPDRPRARGEYFRRDSSPFLKGWQPELRDKSDDVRQAYAKAAARAIDSMQNSGFIAGVVEASAAATVGPELRLALRPDYRALGWSEERAKSWARYAEGVYNAWARSPIDCDASGKMTVGQMHQVGHASYLAFGEILQLLPVVRRREGAVPTKVLMLPPSRLKNKSDSDGLVEGVRVDSFGFPMSYVLEKRKKSEEIDWIDEVEVRHFDRVGRRNVTHIISPGTATTRGISPLAPALKVVRQLEQYCDATLTAALLQTIFAATIRTDAQGVQAYEGLMTQDEQGPEALDLDAFAAAKAEWYEEAKIDLATHGRIAHLFPNDQLEFHKAEHPSQQFDMVMRWLAFEISRAAGVTYETVTGDYRSATYSSVRMATSENWNIVSTRRRNVNAPHAQSIFETFLEDGIGSGLVEYPGGIDAFRSQKVAACRARWDGPPKPQADDLKAANAHSVLYELGATTLQQICSDYGDDWEDVLEQRAREREHALSLGLPDPNEKVQAPPKGEGDRPGDPRGSTEDRSDDGGGSGSRAEIRAELRELLANG